MFQSTRDINASTIEVREEYDSYFQYIRELNQRYKHNEITLEEANELKDIAYENIINQSGPIQRKEFIDSYKELITIVYRIL